MNETLQSQMDTEDMGLEALTKIAGKPKRKEKFPRFSSVYIQHEPRGDDI